MRPETQAILTRVDEAAAFIRAHLTKPEEAVGVILGSGLGAFAEHLEGATALPYEEIPGFPSSGVVGHAGRLVIGTVGGREACVMQGRAHLYEGWSMDEVVLPIRAFARLGIPKLVITNAAGGLDPAFTPGDLMVIRDHLNLTGRNPLVGENLDALGPRFPDLSQAYPAPMRTLAHDTARRCGLTLREGIYMGLLGPSYETPTEVKMFRLLGADAVGMSTVNEVIAAAHAGVQVLGLSCITNLAAGISDTPIEHAEVTDTGARVASDFVRLLAALVPAL
jgi:purine-nucleoside phosphorylase